MNSFEQHELALDDEAFALLGDGYDLAASFSSFTYNSTSGSASTPGHDNSAEPDDALLALLADSELGEFAMNWDTSPLFLAHEGGPQNELPPAQPAAARVKKPQSKKAKSKKATGKDSPAASTALAAPAAVITKRPRKHNRIEILKLKQEMEELQAQLSSLQLNQKRPTYGAIAIGSSQPGTLTQHSLRFKHAEEQYKALQHSEMLNRRLRSAVAQQQSVTSSLQALFQQTVSPQVRRTLLYTLSLR